MDRRTFITGAVALATVPFLPQVRAPYSKPVVHQYTRMSLENTLLTPEEIGKKMAEALAKSMMMTKEQMAANVLTRAFWDHDRDILNIEAIPAEDVYA